MSACRTCGNEAWSRLRTMIENGQFVDQCDRCSSFTASTFHDVYFKRPYYSEALDREFTSKAQKAGYLKAHGLSEAGDIKQGQKSWQEGTRPYRQKQFDKDRPMIRRVYKEWRDRASRK